MKQKKRRLFFQLFLPIGAILILLNSCREDAPTEGHSSEAPQQTVLTFEIIPSTKVKTFQVEGTVKATKEVHVSFPIRGVFEEGKYRMFDQFETNEIIAKLERVEVLYELLATREAFKQTVQNTAQSMQSYWPELASKWQEYGTAIHRTEILPLLPEVQHEEELAFLDSFKVLSSYKNIRELETYATQHFYTAPFDGFISKSLIQPGDSVYADKRIFTIVATDSLHYAFKCSSSEFNAILAATHYYLTSSNGDTIPKEKLGNFLKLKDDEQQDIRLYSHALKPAFYQQLLSLNYTKEIQTAILPKSAIYDDHIYYWDSGEATPFAIDILTKATDSVEISAPKSGWIVLDVSQIQNQLP